jgi:hypothetical protein
VLRVEPATAEKAVQKAELPPGLLSGGSMSICRASDDGDAAD